LTWKTAYFGLFLLKNNKPMTVVRLEVLKKEDLELIVKLAERLQVGRVDVFEDGIENHPIFGPPMNQQELGKYLEKGLEGPEI
jgi:hypothetical protein